MADQGQPRANIDVNLIKDSIQVLVETRMSLEAARLVRELNLKPKRPSSEEMKQLDSSIKRNGTLVKKLQKLTEESCSSLLDEISKVNQSKYISEVVAALSEAAFNVKDLPAALQVCSLLHQRYSEFGEQIGPALARVFTMKAASVEEERVFAKRKRSNLRLFSDLMVSGVVCPQGMQPLLGIVQDLAATSTKKDREVAQNAISLLAQFAKGAREQLLGLPASVPALQVPSELLQDTASPQTLDQLPANVQEVLSELRKQQQALETELARQYRAPADDRAAYMKVVNKTFQASCTALSEDHKALCNQELENNRIVNSRGDLPSEVAAEYEKQRKAYEGLHRAVSTLAEALDQPMPELVEDAFTRLGGAEGAGTTSTTQAGSSSTANQEFQVFEDLESRMFYQSLPDIKSMVPGVLLGLAPEPSTTSDSLAPKEEKSTEPDASAEDAVPSAVPTPPSEDAAQGEESKGMRGSVDGKGDKSEGQAESQSASSQVDAILAKLQHCVSRDMCDELSVNFCFNNSKGARRKLLRSLCDVPKACLQLVPFYARIVATLAPVFPDLLQGVLSHLEAEFQSLLARKDATSITLEPRVRNARYLAELAKFKLYPPGSFFVALKQLLDDFSHHNIDAACAMVETAGRALIRMPETKTRMENMLEVMMKLKNIKNLDARRCSQVEWAYIAVKQPGKAAPRKTRPPMQEYIRHLILVRLNKKTVGDVAKKLLKVPWAEQERYILKCLMKVVRGRYTNIPLVSALVGGLAQVHDSLGIAFVDQVLEDIRWGLENPLLGTYQKRLADLRLLGELYNYSLFNSTPIFETLYLIITFGHEHPDLAMKVDPPDDYYRIRMVCTLLDTCGMYFGEGRAASKLDRFITFFQAYLLSKQQPVPLDVEFDVQDVLHHLRPKLVRYSMYEEAMKAVSDILSSEAALGGSGMLGAIDEEDEEDEERREIPSAGSEDEREAMGEGSRGSSVGGSSGLDPTDGKGQEIDADFEREYMQLMFEAQGKVATKTPVLLPPNMISSAAMAAASSTFGMEDLSLNDADQEGQLQQGMAFKMLMKKGGKDDKTKEIMVPATARIAVSLREREDAEAREREEMKRLTLLANRHQEQEQAAIHRAQLRGLPPPQTARPQHHNISSVGDQSESNQGEVVPGASYHHGGGSGRGGGRGRSSAHQFGNVDALGLDHRTVPRGLRPVSGRGRGGRG